MNEALRRGVFRDVGELIMAIESYIDRHNESPKPFIWTAKANDISQKVKRSRKALYYHADHAGGLGGLIPFQGWGKLQGISEGSAN